MENASETGTWTSVYAAGTYDFIRSIPTPHNGTAAAVAFDRTDAYYRADWVLEDVTVMKPNGQKVSYSIDIGGSPWALAFDPSGRLYVANYASFQNQYGRPFVSVIDPGAHRPAYSFHKGLLDVPNKIAFDSTGNLYVANVGLYAPPAGNGDIAIYRPGAKVPSRIITDGIYGVSAMKIDSANTLYVANGGIINGDYYNDSIPSDVVVYAPGAKAPSRIIETGISLPTAIAIDAEKNIYVANRGTRTVTVYSPGSNTPSRTISLTSDGYGPVDMIIDHKGNIVVSNLPGGSSYAGSVSIYAPGAASPTKVITQGINSPGSIAIAP